MMSHLDTTVNTLEAVKKSKETAAEIQSRNFNDFVGFCLNANKLTKKILLAAA